MYPSHLGNAARAERNAELLHEAEHARLVRQARQETSRHLSLSHWCASVLQHLSPFWLQGEPQRRAEILVPALPVACCAACAC